MSLSSTLLFFGCANLYLRKEVTFLISISSQQTLSYFRIFMAKGMMLLAKELAVSCSSSMFLMSWISWMEQLSRRIKMTIDFKTYYVQFFELMRSFSSDLQRSSSCSFKLGSWTQKLVSRLESTSDLPIQLGTLFSRPALRRLLVSYISTSWESSLWMLKRMTGKGLFLLILGAESMQQLVMSEQRWLERLGEMGILRQVMMMATPVSL